MTFSFIASTSQFHFPRVLSITRRATTLSGTSPEHSKHPYPFPNHPRPTPHEIFHLPIGASPSEIKSRYYDLVRYHHPDSPYARTHTPSANERTTRFQYILSAYHSLRYPSARYGAPGWAWAAAHYGHGPGFDPYVSELNRRRRPAQNAEYMRRRKQAMEDEKREREREEWRKTVGAGVSASPREWMMLVVGVVVLVGGLYPSLFLFPFRMERMHQAAVGNLARARDDAEEVGHVRREEVRRRVRDIKAAKEVEERRKCSENEV